MQTTGNAVVADKTEKAGEKVMEKRRALGRGLESLLPGPRVVPTNTPTPSTSSGQALPQSTREDGALAAVDDERAIMEESARAGADLAPLAGEEAGTADGDGRTGVPAPQVDLQAMASREVAGQPVIEIPVSHIDHNPHQTRDYFDPGAMEDLARSIRVQGVIQPIVVRPGKEGHYILVLGERRLRASKMAGKATIPALVKRVSEQQAAEMTIIENLLRDDLMCMEQANAFWTLSQDFNLTQEEIGKRVGVSRETVSNYLRLLNLPVQVQTFLNRGDLTYSHARELLVLKDDEQIRKLGELAVRKNMSVVQLEQAVLEAQVENPEGDRKPGGARWVDPNVRAAQRNLEMILGMRVRIRDRRGKGKITIEYSSIEDYERVVGMLKGKISSQ